MLNAGNRRIIDQNNIDRISRPEEHGDSGQKASAFNGNLSST